MLAATRTVSSLLKGGDLRLAAKQKSDIQNVICHKQSRICFVLTETKTIVVLNSGTFILEPLEVPGDLWRRRLNKIRGLILTRKIKTYDDLISVCRPGIRMTFVRLDWYV